MADPKDPRFWPKFSEVPGFPQAMSCSVCGALVVDTFEGRGNHQLFHGMIWRLVIGDPNAVNTDIELDVRAWLHAIDEKADR